MKNIGFIFITILLIGCSNQHSENNNKKYDVPFINYSNEYFSINYPENWEYEEEINSEFDSIPEMSTGIRTTFFPKSQYAPFHTVCVQKSAMFYVFNTPEEWRDLSITMKNFNDEYIGTVDSMMLDSLKFGPYPAAMAGFAVDLGGDTIIHKQLVVMVNQDVYYLNNSFDMHDDGSMELYGDSILSTVRFKTDSL